MLAVRDLILERGYGGASVEAICARAEVSKGSFFHHFKSKEDAAIATLDAFMENMANLGEESGFRNHEDPGERLRAYLDFMGGVLELPNAPRGCLLGALALELSETYPEVRAKATAYFERWSGMIAELIREALGDEEFDRAVELANHLVATMEGALLLAKTRQDPSIVRRSVAHFQQYIDSLKN